MAYNYIKEVKETFRVKMESVEEIKRLPDGTSLVDSKDNWYHKKSDGIEKTNFWNCTTLIPFANINIADGFRATFEKVEKVSVGRKKKSDGNENEVVSISQICVAN